MKKLTLLLVCICTVFTLQANNGDKYEKAMKANLSKLKTAKTKAELLAVANQFERIGNAESNKWLPGYYAAYCYIRMARLEKEATSKDQVLDKAAALLEKANKIDSKNSELVTLGAYLTLTRLSVDPMVRGREYSGRTFAKIGKAKALNPANPRPYFIEAILKMNMPPAFGGGKEAACPVFKKAAKKFEAFKPGNGLMPDWGKETNAAIMKQGGC
ncbi:hypothetical protein [Microscilla marina]|uniref:hypothetical protein n=1 Tax=Microscilla marina TaxID=1027 RepID=UPI0002E4D3CF|nr:hypothetical protein [Microscilla marina]